MLCIDNHFRYVVSSTTQSLYKSLIMLSVLNIVVHGGAFALGLPTEYRPTNRCEIKTNVLGIKISFFERISGSQTDLSLLYLFSTYRLFYISLTSVDTLISLTVKDTKKSFSLIFSRT